MLTTIFMFMMTLMMSGNVNPQNTPAEIEVCYERTIAVHEQLLDSWHQICCDSAISPVVSYFDSLDIVCPNPVVKWNKARSHYVLGSICSYNLDYVRAMEHFVVALETLEDISKSTYETQKHRLVGLIDKKISSLFLFCELFDKSFDMQMECINEFLACNDSSRLVVEYLTLGSFCDMLGENGSNPDTNLYYIRKAENYLRGFPEQSYERAYYDYCLSYYYKSINQHDTALTLQAKALRNMPQHNSFYYSMNRAAAFAFYADGKYDSALYYALEAFKSPDFFDQRDAAEGLSEIYKEIGDESESAKYASIYRDAQSRYLDIKIQNAAIEKIYDTYLHKVLTETKEKHGQPIWLVAALILMSAIIILWMKRLGTKKNKPDNNAIIPTVETMQSMPNREEMASALFLERWSAFQETEIFNSIIDRCNDNKNLMAETIMYFDKPLTISEMSLFKATLDSLFNDFTNRFSLQHSDLTSVELDYCFVSILPLSETQKAGLFSLSYQGMVSRRKRVTNKLKEALCDQKLTDFMKKAIKDGLV